MQGNEKSALSPTVKYFADQFDDESVEFVFRKHPIVMRRGLIYSCLALLIGTLPGLFSLENSIMIYGLIGGLVLAAIVFLPSWIRWYFSVYIVTDQRFIQIHQRGLFRRAVSDIGLNQIQSMNYAVTGIIETVFGIGTIILQTYMGDIELYSIGRPSQVQNSIQLVLRQQGIDSALLGPIQSNQEGAEE